MVNLHSCVSCTSNNNFSVKQANNNNNSNNARKYNNDFLKLSLIFVIWSFLTLVVHGAAVYSNVDFLSNPNFEPICSAQQEHFIESDGKESSLILEFKPSAASSIEQKSCTRILSAPSNYGFIVRLILPKIRHGHHQAPIASTTAAKSVGSNTKQQTAAVSSSLNEMSTLIEKINSTSLKTILGRTCPLSIFSSLDPHIPQWRVDPCQLEDTAPEMEDPVRLFHGRVRIVWEHSDQMLNSKLMVTALGKGEQCRGDEKHQCLKIGDEPILCISKDLVCDGIRHCPYSNEYDSDEDYSMCWKRRRFGEPLPPAMESDIFEHFALEVFRNLFAFDVPTAPDVPVATTTTTSAPATSSSSSSSVLPANSSSSSSTTLRKVETKDMHEQKKKNDETNGNGNNNSIAVNETEPKTENNTDVSGSGFHRRNSTRSGLHSDLSKYGPWGYLMLGMLLCGGALLICGLWASASQHAVNNEREAALANGAANGISNDHQSSTAAPPNYEELDPPPAYSVLFPNQKAVSSNTLNALEINATSATTPIAASSGIRTPSPQLTQPTAENSTRVQIDNVIASGSQHNSEMTN